MIQNSIKTILLGLVAWSSHLAFADDTKLELSAKTAPAFEVKDLPLEAPIEGQLGGPGAPSLKDQQERLAKSMLEKGICNASFYGEDFCRKQEAKSYRVTDQFGTKAPAQTATKAMQE